jgi:CO/xanthine dehydrogenase Mo-binding subunit
MRHDATGWDPKGPAAVISMKAGIDADGAVTGFSFYAKGFSGQDVSPSGAAAGDTLAGMLTGFVREGNDTFGVPGESYGFANKRLGWDVIEPFLFQASPLRSAHIRDPQGPQTTFASESFIDEVAFELGLDPVEFRLQYLQDPRHIAAVKAAAEAAGWETRPSPNPVQDDPDVLTGRGIAYAQRGQTVVAIVVEVEVNRETGRVWPKRYTVAHDCGLIVNPKSLRNTIEGAVMQATSRTLYEEVQFDESNVTSRDWNAYPILDITDTPEDFTIVFLEDKNDGPYGAGEPGNKPVPAALANAIFDATGVRMRRTPFRAERVKAALDANA